MKKLIGTLIIFLKKISKSPELIFLYVLACIFAAPAAIGYWLDSIGGGSSGGPMEYLIFRLFAYWTLGAAAVGAIACLVCLLIGGYNLICGICSECKYYWKSSKITWEKSEEEYKIKNK